MKQVHHDEKHPEMAAEPTSPGPELEVKGNCSQDYAKRESKFKPGEEEETERERERYIYIHIHMYIYVYTLIFRGFI